MTSPPLRPQVGQVRNLLEQLSRHVEEVQKTHVVILSNPDQEQSESRVQSWERQVQTHQNWTRTPSSHTLLTETC